MYAYENLYLQYWMSSRSTDLESRESYSHVCMEEFLNLDEAYDFA